jgi:hypothetical protein
MEKSTKIVAQVYGYAICLVAVITFIVSVTSMVSAVIDLGDPLHSGWNQAGSPSLASYENYKMDILRSMDKDAMNKQGITVNEQTLRTMYDAAKNDKIQSIRHRSNGTIIITGISLVIAILLFITHWSWMKKLSKQQVMA